VRLKAITYDFYRNTSSLSIYIKVGDDIRRLNILNESMFIPSFLVLNKWEDYKLNLI